MTSSIPAVIPAVMKSDIDINSSKGTETDEDSFLSLHFMNCNIIYPLLPKQNNKVNHSILYGEQSTIITFLNRILLSAVV